MTLLSRRAILGASALAIPMPAFARRRLGQFGGGGGSSGVVAPNATVVYFGNSLVASMYTAAAPIYSNLNDGFGTWANASAQALPFVPLTGNLGIAGNTTTDMLSRIATVTAVNPAIVVMDGGVNDVLADVSASTILSNLQACYTAILLSGTTKRIIQTTIAPFYAPTTLSPAQEAVRQAVNVGLYSIPGISVVNLEAVVTASDVLADGYHYNTLGASKVGAAVGGALAAAFTSGDIFTLLTNTYSPNATLSGTGGSLSGGATGVVATGFTLFGDFLGGAAVVGAKETFAGAEWQTLTISGNYTGDNRQAFLDGNSASTGLIATDRVEGIFEIFATGLVAIQSINITVSVVDAGFSFLLIAKGGVAAGAATTAMPSSMPTPIAFRTPPGVIAAGVPNLVITNFNINFMPGGAATPVAGKVWLRRNLIREIP